MLLDLVEQTSIADVEILRGTAAIPSKSFQRILDHFDLRALLYVTNDGSNPGAGRRCINETSSWFSCRRRGDLCFELSSSGVGISHHHRSGNEITEFPEVSAPIVKQGNVHQSTRETS